MRNIEETVIRLMQDYLQCNIESGTFFKKIRQNIEEVRNHKNLPEWLNTVIVHVKATDNEKALELDGYIDENILRVAFMKTLQRLKDENKYIDIIKTDYSKYL